MAQYERYARDGEILAAIGQEVRDADGTGPVTLPLELARAAVAAWLREEPDEPASPESPWQVHVRRQAAALALIGEEIEKRSDLGSDPVSVNLGAGVIQVAIAAAEGRPGDRPEDQPGDRPEDQPGGRPEDQPGGQPGDRPQDQPGGQADGQAEDQGGERSLGSPALRAARRLSVSRCGPLPAGEDAGVNRHGAGPLPDTSS